MGSHLSTTKPLRGRVTSSRARTQSHQCGNTARERERAVAEGTESSAAEMNQSSIEETLAQKELVPANPACFVEENIPMGQGKWIDIPANKWHQEDARSTEISKLVMRFGRHFDQDEKENSTALFFGIRWEQNCGKHS